jgi:hypothetical protein
MDKQFELATLEDSDLSGVRGGFGPFGDPYGGGYGYGGPSMGGGYADPAGESNTGEGGLIGLGGLDLNLLGIASQ